MVLVAEREVRSGCDYGRQHYGGGLGFPQIHYAPAQHQRGCMGCHLAKLHPTGRHYVGRLCPPIEQQCRLSAAVGLGGLRP